MLNERVRTLRKSRGMSLRELAAATGVSAALLSQVERGTTDPSLNTVRKLAAVLGADLATLFAEEPPAQVHHSRPRQRPLLSAGAGLMSYERLTPGRSDLEVLHGRLAPGQATSEEPWAHPSTECAVVVVGSMSAEVDGVRYDLAIGESLTFDSRLPHRFFNDSGAPAEYLLAVTPPVP
ncbi:helix-turn-helix domain-containing protein [Blastococcus sp. VKM Ac-2987]|uniref:helix-turn-helix domain-containing protein n=1 Tax=Blastococcus sp. VKM Ac-2987 TaxID=3004141 RepID=UPI0022ABC48E|nr:XRE family transcriptional regulator [Blastococcus sp. VKM Ac-2987]MCZ2857577.1 XRE family transcriptional regulator [Blastococcus sp. VKM Ac-2987]